MSRRLWFLFPLLLLVGAVSIGFEVAAFSQRRAEQESLGRSIAAADRTLAQLARQRTALARDVALAEQQLARIPPVRLPEASSAVSADDQVVAAWQVRAATLRDLAARTPAALIPEMKLLDDEDWLRVAQTAAFDTEAQRRQALAKLRTAAKARFEVLLAETVARFKTAHGDRIPATALDLAPFLTPPADAAMLARYAVMHRDPYAQNSRDGWGLRETSAVDADYDSRHTVSSNGGRGSSSGFSAWIDDLTPRLRQARQAYAAANHGAQPAGISQVLPFLDPPLPPQAVEKLLEAERNRPR